MRPSQTFRKSFALFGLLIALCTAIPMAALSDESHIWIVNNTPDGWAFVSESHGLCLAVPPAVTCGYHWVDSWCVAPGSGVERRFPFRVEQVRVQVTKTKDCRVPIEFTKVLPYSRSGAVNVYKVNGHLGYYSVTGQAH
jgi:hypothetical protein